ncbi:MAG TPA: GNAT family N-acetyltransferase [Armatimonadota bacterium]|nr:GNAT family N-acetyltransferase [Armatimonadota bacterium]
MALERIERLTDAQVEDLCRLYSGEWWCRARTPDGVRKMLEHTDLVVALAETGTGRLVAFSRVLTDRTYKALIFDVIVDAAHRGEGLGRLLMDAIFTHPLLSTVESFELYCLPERVPFYRKWGFTDELGDLRFMRASRAGAERGRP